MSASHSIQKQEEVSSNALCTRCFQIQDFVKVSFTPEILAYKYRSYLIDEGKVELLTDEFQPSSMKHETCGVCRILYRAAESIAIDRLDDLWQVRVDDRIFKFNFHPPSDSTSRGDFNITLCLRHALGEGLAENELEVQIFSTPGK